MALTLHCTEKNIPAGSMGCSAGHFLALQPVIGISNRRRHLGVGGIKWPEKSSAILCLTSLGLGKSQKVIAQPFGMEGRVGQEGQECFSVRLRSVDYSAANLYGFHSAVINLQTMAETYVMVVNQRIRKFEGTLGIIQSNHHPNLWIFSVGSLIWRHLTFLFFPLLL